MSYAASQNSFGCFSEFIEWPHLTQPSRDHRTVQIIHDQFTATMPSVSQPVYPLMPGHSLSGGLEMTRQLDLHVERIRKGLIIISDDEFMVYGEGKTYAEALIEYKASMADYFELVHDSAQDHPPSLALFDKLLEYIQPIAL